MALNPITENCQYDIVICYLRCIHADERTGHGDCISTCAKNDT